MVLCLRSVLVRIRFRFFDLEASIDGYGQSERKSCALRLLEQRLRDTRLHLVAARIHGHSSPSNGDRALGISLQSTSGLRFSQSLRHRDIPGGVFTKDLQVRGVVSGCQQHTSDGLFGLNVASSISGDYGSVAIRAVDLFFRELFCN
jgi:hypothetical protein